MKLQSDAHLARNEREDEDISATQRRKWMTGLDLNLEEIRNVMTS